MNGSLSTVSIVRSPSPGDSRSSPTSMVPARSAANWAPECISRSWNSTSGYRARYARKAWGSPVNTTEETFGDPHMLARGTLVEPDGVAQPAPAPRFSGTPAAVDRPPPEPGEHTDDVLAELGYDRAAIETLRRAGAIH